MRKGMQMRKRLMVLLGAFLLVVTDIGPVFATGYEQNSLSENSAGESTQSGTEPEDPEGGQPEFGEPEPEQPEVIPPESEEPETEELEAENQTGTEDDQESSYGFKDIPERVVVAADSYYQSDKFYIYLYNNDDMIHNVTISSTNTDVVKIKTEEAELKAHSGTQYLYIYFKNVGVGAASIKLKMDDYECEIPFYRYESKQAAIESVTQVDYNTLKFEWSPVNQYSGYYIKRAKYSGTYISDSEYETVATVEGGKVAAAELDVSDWDTQYSYIVKGYMRSGEDYYEPSVWSQSVNHTMEKMGAELISAEKTGDNQIRITWESVGEAQKYQLYRSTQKNGTYKKIYSGKSTITEYTDKVTPGVTYYYKLKTVYPEFTSQYSSTVSKMLPKSAKTKSKWLSLSGTPYIGEQYGTWASPDDAAYYVASGKFHVVYPGKNCIKVYTLDSSFKKKTSKTIKIKFDQWGGFYAAPDGNFYVVLGYSNPKESKKKTVIKVIKYNKNWKEVKTANIKGGVKNYFTGIYQPFEAGSCAMDMQGNTLYIHTARKMFILGDGLRHQSNISFAVNTKTMKAEATQDTYASHSFNQYARFSDGDLYLLDHGDAYPRAVCLTVMKDYDKDTEKVTEYEIFRLKGSVGQNFTGCTVGGMEIADENVLVCGTAHPHYSKVKGVKGSEYGYAYNAYVLVTNKETGKTKVKWLTNYNPKNSKVSVGGTRMIKLDDDHFAVMYTTTKEGVSTLNYVVVNGNGKKLYTKKYTDKTFRSGTQPILYDGRVVWISYEYNAEKQKYQNKIHAIPALVE